MPHSESPDPKLVAAVTSVVEGAKTLDPDETQNALDLLKHLKELEVYLERTERGDLRAVCASAMRMCEHVIRRTPAKPEEIVSWVQSLAHVFEGAAHAGSATAPAIGKPQVREPEKAIALPPESSTAINKKLTLVDGQRLGEILVRMSYLHHKDVQKALDMQRSKGMRLGDAMVELKLLSREELDAALRVQKQRRNRNSDPWMNPEELESGVVKKRSNKAS